MKCPSCGAVYDDHNLNCPFCRSENTIEADRRYKSELQSIKKKTSQLKYLPMRIIKLLRKSTTWIIIGLLLIILVFYIVREFKNSKVDIQRLSDREYHRDILEDYFSQGDYELMYSYYNDHDGLYGDMFEKYYEVGRSFDYLLTVRSSEACLRNEQEDYKCGINNALYAAFSLLEFAEPAIEDNLILDNEDVLKEFIRETYDYFTLLQLSEDEITTLKSDYNSDFSILDNTTDTILSRLELSE